MKVGEFLTQLALAQVMYSQGTVDSAEVMYREGLALSREMPLLTNIATGLEGLAAVAAMVGLPVRAARLWGAAEALREATGEGRSAFFQRAYDRALAAARRQVSEADWATAWAAGRALTTEQAVAEALADIDTTPNAGKRVRLVGSGSI